MSRYRAHAIHDHTAMKSMIKIIVISYFVFTTLPPLRGVVLGYTHSAYQERALPCTTVHTFPSARTSNPNLCIVTCGETPKNHPQTWLVLSPGYLRVRSACSTDRFRLLQSFKYHMYSNDWCKPYDYNSLHTLPHACLLQDLRNGATPAICSCGSATTRTNSTHIKM